MTHVWETKTIGLSQRVEVLTKEAEGALMYGGFDLEEIAAQNRFLVPQQASIVKTNINSTLVGLLV